MFYFCSMRSAADIAAEMDEGLSLLFQKGLELSLQVQADGMAAGDPAERARLAISFHRLSRSVRQTAALRLRLAREAEACAREDVKEAAVREAARRGHRKAQARAGVERLLWTEYEPDDDDAADILARLDKLLAAEAEFDDFLIEDLDEQVARLCEAVDYAPPDLTPAGGDPGEGSVAPDPAPSG